MELSEYLKSAFSDQTEAARTFGVTQGTISHWIAGRRKPRPTKALEIIQHSRGKVNYQSIYGGRQ